MKFRTGLVLYLSASMIFSGCVYNKSAFSMMRDISPTDQLINDEIMRSEYTGDIEKDKGVDMVRWYLIILSTVTVTTLTLLMIQAKQREASVPDYDNHYQYQY